ncbi:MAG: toxin-antitoxin system HicB family antitoxin [Chloroflexi bacterium HGW-Chloroflexi-10]|nr:MAG: toxin-antitoxin system HicB family antitoxin [Chloroflexi bacterium HGW-Chloroflexi-10]
MEKDLKYYLSLPYTIEIFRDNDEENPGWVAKVVELPGCITQGDTFEELGEMIEDAMRGWVEIALADGISVPEPRARAEFSGKFVVRLPKSLHRELAETAERENVSLNAYVSAALAKAVGRSGVEGNPAASETSTPTLVNWPKLSDPARRI